MADNTWRVRDMDTETIKKIKWYAIQHELSMAQAIKALVNKAMPKVIDELLDNASKRNK